MSALSANHSPPSNWVQRHIGLIQPGARVLDLACGSGRHTRLLHAHNYSVLAADHDLSRMSELRNTDRIELRLVDLETQHWPFQTEKFAGIIVTNYLYRPHMQSLVSSLKEDGVLIYATFAAGNEAFGRPDNPDFLLRPNELNDTFGKHLFVIACEQVTEHGAVSAVRQRICATGMTHPAASS